MAFAAQVGQATPFTTTVPGTGVALPTQYPQAGGVAIVMTGVNGNIYYQFSDPTGAFVGYQNTGAPAAFRGNPFTINNPIALDCGFRTCVDYFGGAIAQIDVRFSAYDGDTEVGGFDYNDITLRMNGFDVGNWSNRPTEITNDAGTVAFGTDSGFGNNTFNTGWFSSTNAALLANILSTGRTSTQVYDRDPNDNYWDFQRGTPLADPGLRTIAPGYELDKVLRGGATTFAAVGQVLTYDYLVRNIGSVDISNVAVSDNKIGTVICSPTTLPKTLAGGTAATATCSATYVVTQADFDARSLTNVAVATGKPAFGVLGALTDTVILTGPALAPAVTLTKTANPTAFSTVGQVITYSFTITNTGNATLTNVVVTDPKLPALSCTIASVAPISTVNTVNTATCSGAYTVTQADIDAFAINGTQLANTATVNARAPNGTTVSATANRSIAGPVAAPAMILDKTALQTSFNAVGNIIQYRFAVRNTGNVTWPGPPTISDALTGAPTCPAGAVAPGATVTCAISYTVTQANLDAGPLNNSATASITVAGKTATSTDTNAIAASVTTGLTIVKQLRTGSPSPFSTLGAQLVYDYVLRNTGTVTLSSAAVTDNKVAVTCPVTPIAPGATLTCTSAPYSVTQPDLNAGKVTNTASGTARTPQNVAVNSTQTSLTVNGTQSPAFTMVKTAPTVSPLNYVVGGTVVFTYRVTNSGNVTSAAPIRVTDNRFGAALTCSATALAPAAQATCSQTYTFTAADIAAGFVTNTASATDGVVSSNTASVTVPQAGSPGLTLVKASTTPSFDKLADTISYTFTVTNSGNTQIVAAQPITVTDPKVGAVSCAGQPAILNTVASGLSPNNFQCTASFAGLTQADIDAGRFSNTASASFTYTGPGGTTVITSPSSSVTVPAAITPAFLFDKTGPASFGPLPQTIIYGFSITNQTAQTLSRVVVTDPRIPTLSCTRTNIVPFGVVTCSGTYQVTQADMDAGVIANTASAVGTAPDGSTINRTDTVSVPIASAANTRSMTLDKQSSVTSFSAVGNQNTYTFELRNTGNLTLSNIAVNDTALGFTCTIPTLAPGAINRTCTKVRTVTQADIDAGSIVNSATATAPGAANATDTNTVNGPARTASFVFAKTADGPFTLAGDVVRFTLAVKNTGTVSLTAVAITDAFFNPDLTCNIAAILPGVTNSSCTGTYTVTQADVDAGQITNTAGLTAGGVGGAPLTGSATAVVPGPAEAPAMRVVKTEVDGTSRFGGAGVTENYTFEVFNDGNVTLTGITLTDALTGFTCALADILPGTSTTQCANSSPLFTSHVITQADVDRGALSNTVDVTAQTALGTPVTAKDTVVLTGPDQLPDLSVVKTATTGANFATVGDPISYSYLVANTGNVSLTSIIRVTDDKVRVTCPAIPGAGIAPLGSLTCSATYRVTQADLDAGFVTNVAFAATSQAVIPSATYPGGVAAVTSDSDTVTVTAAQLPALSITKRIKPNTASTYDATTDVITFQFTVRNTGNVTTTGDIVVTDANIPATVTCTTAPLAPNATAVCEATWSPTQADIDNGSFVNSATAATTFGGSPVVTPTPATATALAVQTPELTMDKSFASLTNNSFAVGETASYTYLVQNTGNTTITGPISVSDNLIALVTCPAGNLLPGQSLTCTGSYVLLVADVQLGSVTNLARASSGTVVSDPASETIPVNVNATISVDKVANVATFSAVGDQIIYTYTVTNTSQGSPQPALANPILVNDDKFAAPINCTPASQLLVGQSTTCSATYTVTQADLDRVGPGATSGFVTNNASAETAFGGQVIAAPPAQVTVPGVANPALTVTKAVTAGPNPAAAGDTLTYTISTENTGNQTVSGVVVEDPKLTGLACTIGGNPALSPITLAPTDILACTGTYLVTQADVDAQTLSNTASATGSNPQGSIVTDDGTITHPLDPALPAVTVLKSLAQGEPDAAFSAVGQTVTYIITITNSGNITLTATTVTDSLIPGSCTIGRLDPGQIDASCEFVYTVTQADINRGSITNRATAVSQPATPNAPTVTGSDELVGSGPLIEPRVAVTKTPDLANFNAAGQTITYSYVIANTGNVTLFGPLTVGDDKIPSLTCDPFPPLGLLPGIFITCTGTYVTLQADLDSGGITNIAGVSLPDPNDPNAVVADNVTATVPSVRTPAVTVNKVASVTSGVAVGDVITYTYTVENTGNVTLTDVTLSDAHSSAAGTAALAISGGGVIAILAPDASVDLTATYTVTQADIDAGAALTNLVSLTSTSPTGTTAPTATDTASVTPEPAAATLQVIKTVSTLPAFEVGNVIIFDIAVTNTGNVSLGTVDLTDTLTRADTVAVTTQPVPVFDRGDAGVTGTLDVGEIWVYTLSYTLTQSDLDAGGISNTARATALTPANLQVADVSDNGAGNGSSPTVVSIPGAPSLNSVKQITSATTVVGGTVTYSITVTNDGNVKLTGVALASDTLTRADNTALALTSGPTFVSNSLSSAQGTLLRGEVATYSASYVLVQADIDAGGISNTATARGTPPVGPAVTDQSDNGNDTDGNTVDDPTVLPIAATPGLSLVKTLSAGGPTFDTVGDVLTYRFVVRNTGNVTITDPISITDPLITTAGGTITCAPVPLAPTRALVCTGRYRVTQADIDAGSVTNAASATDGTTTSAPDGVTVPGAKNPALTLVKAAQAITVNGVRHTDLAAQYFVVGAVVDYRYTTTNTGNVTITAPVTVTDNLIAAITCPTFPAAGLAPLATFVCTGRYTVTADDVALTSVTNLGSASDGTTTSPIVSETVPGNGSPVLAIAKQLIRVTNPDTSVAPALLFDQVGDVLTYRFTITNTGSLSFVAPLTVTDDKIASPIACYTPSPANPDFTAGEVLTCTADYVVTQADLDAGTVVNQAFAQTQFGAGPTTVTTPPVSETANATQSPQVQIVKSVATLPVMTVGQVLSYTLTIRNIGNQSLTNVAATDPLLPGLVCQSATLTPAAELVCAGDYTVRQIDFDTGTIVNTAAVTATDPSGKLIRDDTSLTVTTPVAGPFFTLIKSASPDPFGPLGSTITYTFTVINNGNVTLTNLAMTDPITSPAFTCTIPVLDVGLTDRCTLDYIITQADLDAGQITNTVSATATDPSNTPITRTDTITTPGPDNAPGIGALDVTKTASFSTTTLGSVVNYELRVRNASLVTLNSITVSDTMTRADGTATALDAPFGLTSGDLDADNRLDVGETWIYAAAHTIDQADINAGGISNTATASGLDPAGNPVADRSDNGNDTDGNTTDDPTVVPIAPQAGLDVVKTVLQAGDTRGDVVIFRIAATNTGNVDLSGVTVSDTLTRVGGADISTEVTGPTLQPPAIGTDPLGVGEVWIWTLSHTLTQADIDAGGISNTASVTGTTPGGDPVTDTSDNGDDTDGNTTDDPTILLIDPVSAIVVGKTASTPVVISGSVFAVDFTLRVENTGNITQTNLIISDDLTVFTAPATLTGVSTPGLSGFGGTNAANPAYDGDTDINTVGAGVSLAPGQTGLVVITVQFDIGTGLPTGVNTVTVTSDLITLAQAATVTVVVTPPAQILATKSVATANPQLGGIVTYVLTFENQLTTPAVGISLIDTLPVGLSYVSGSATFNGAATPQPVVAGRTVTWTGIAMPPGDTVTITLDARIAAGSGSLINRAIAVDQNGTPVSNEATAEIILRPEAVFDCGDVIGKVFDDRNMNGYQDGPNGEDLAAITDQSYVGGKYDVAPVELPGGEPGLPHVRLVTVNGTIITTDEYGRYHVPCAELPAGIGSNFTLKLDERSLPTGYRVTTENPRVVRLTAGGVTKLNFGAAIANVVDIDLTASAFAGATAEPTVGLLTGIDQLVAQLLDIPSVLRLTYYMNGEGRDIARARLDGVETLIRDRWEAAGRYRLLIERTIRQVQ